MSKSLLRFLVILFSLTSILITGCSEKSKPLGANPDETQDVFAWVWAFDEDADSVRIYNAGEGVLKASYSAEAHPMMHIIPAGPASEPTLWMASGNTAYAFTRGFHPHADHAHMEIPEAHAAISQVFGAAHMGSTGMGDTVAFANDDSSTVTIINAATGSARILHNGSPHSAALLASGYLVTTHMNRKWAKIINITADTLLDSIAIDTLAHGDAYYAANNTAFIACKNGIEVLDLNTRTRKGGISYTQSGRTSFLYHAHGSRIALCLHNTGGVVATDKILLLNMANENLEYLAIPGASLDWSINGGHFALSENGKAAILSDLTLARVYQVNLDPASSGYKSVITIAVSAAKSAVAANFDGSHVWVQSGQTVDMYHVESGSALLEKTMAVSQGTDWIYVTSYDGLVIEE